MFSPKFEYVFASLPIPSFLFQSSQPKNIYLMVHLTYTRIHLFHLQCKCYCRLHPPSPLDVWKTFDSPRPQLICLLPPSLPNNTNLPIALWSGICSSCNPSLHQVTLSYHFLLCCVPLHFSLYFVSVYSQDGRKNFNTMLGRETKNHD